MWIWLAFLDLKVHVFKGQQFHGWNAPVALLLVLAITLVTAASFYLNAVFAFAISQPEKPLIRPAFVLARRHLGVVPARIVGIKPVGSRRDKLAATAIAGTLGALVCTPAYVIGRIGILLLGSNVLFALGVVLLVLGFALESGATGAVKAIKMSAKLASGTVATQSSGSPAGGGS